MELALAKDGEIGRANVRVLGELDEHHSDTGRLELFAHPLAERIVGVVLDPRQGTRRRGTPRGHRPPFVGAPMSGVHPMEFVKRPLPFVIRAANAGAEALGIGVDSLKPERLMEDAGRVAALPPEFPAHVREALDVLHRSLRDEAKLHWLGLANNRFLLVIGLAQFLQVEKLFADEPWLADEPLLSPVIVAGLPRSGTTFLHRLLAAAPDAAGVPLHRHIYPLRAKPIDYRRLEVEAKFFPWLMASKVYDLDAVHYVRPGLPDECNFGMRLGGRSMIYWGTNPVHTYLRWVMGQDMKETYQLYRKVLILHQRAFPGRRLTLKCPHHFAWLPALTEALPEATIVHPYREPMQILPSECKLIVSLHCLSSREVDWKRTVESNHFKVHAYARRFMDFVDGPAANRLVHVDYRELVRDPVAVAHDVHQRMGLPLTDEHRATLARFASNNRQHKHGRNTYSLEQFGLDARHIADGFAAYRERFILSKPQ